MKWSYFVWIFDWPPQNLSRQSCWLFTLWRQWRKQVWTDNSVDVTQRSDVSTQWYLVTLTEIIPRITFSGWREQKVERAWMIEVTTMSIDRILMRKPLTLSLSKNARSTRRDDSRISKRILTATEQSVDHSCNQKYVGRGIFNLFICKKRMKIFEFSWRLKTIKLLNP